MRNGVKLRYLGPLWKYLLGLGVLAYFLWSNWSGPDGQPGLSIILRRSPQVLPLALAALAYLVGLLITFFRWYVLVRAQRLPFTLANALRLGSVGFFLSALLPGSIGGDIIKAASVAREQSRRTIAVATVLLDRAIGLWGLTWLVAVAGGVFWLAGNPAVTSVKWLETLIGTTVGIVAGTVVLWLGLGVLPQWRAEKFAWRLGRIPKVGHSIAEFWRAIWIYRCQGPAVGAAIGLSMLSHTCFTFAVFLSAHVFLEAGQPEQIPSLAQHFLIVPVASACEAFFPAPGGLGAGEGLYGWFYETLGALAATGVAAALAKRIVTTGWAVAAYIVYLRMRPAMRAVAEETGDRAAA
jgi:uncharacterized membrane protein YbhN (UPF0104 family)